MGTQALGQSPCAAAEPALFLDHVPPAGPSEEPAAGESFNHQAALSLPGVWETIQHSTGL